ncbi:MAG: PQQ-like beta-propeller repeat protein, partial [Proteobacteria bacterium]|nr:PQQ-like beta-propeller repeat protein [Pseudomonadota bacterium]
MMLRLSGLLLGLLLFVSAAPKALGVLPQAQDAGLAGPWRGEAGTSDNHAVFGLEFRPAADGRLKAYFYLDNLDYCGIAIGTLEPAGSAGFAIAGAGLKLVRDGATLHVAGLLPEPQQSVAFTRASALPKCAPEPNSPAGPGPLWERRLGGAIYATAAVRDGYAYVGNTDGVFAAVAIADGSIAWTQVPGRPIYGEALVTADAVFYVCDNGFLYRLDRATGKEQWRYDLGDGRSTRVPPNPNVYDYDRQSPRPLLVDGVLYVGAGDGSFHAVRADAGTRLWRTQWPGRIRTTAVAHADDVIFTTIDG